MIIQRKNYMIVMQRIITQTGVYTFEDVNKDGVLTQAGDYRFLGNIDPKFYGGIQNNITYKNFDLAFFFQFTKQMGPSFINQVGSYSPGRVFNQPVGVLDRWQKPGDITTVQKFAADFFGASSKQSTYSNSDAAYSDASFIKLKNVSFSYRLPTKLLKSIGMSSCKIFTEAQNLLTITNYLGADPETKDIYILPPLRTIAFGIQLNL